MDIQNKPYSIFLGENKTVLATLDNESVSSVITDPPYGLGKPPDILQVINSWLSGKTYNANSCGFMGESWDSFVPQPDLWKECYRVLKPGGHILAFGGTRTYDLLVLGLRLAGFEIRDQIAWIYGQGMPKSKDLGSGWGTTLKPAMEPIVVARKPFSGTISQHFVQNGIGGLNIEACRVYTPKSYKGRFPANIVHDGTPEVLSEFPETKKGGSLTKKYSKKKGVCYGQYSQSNLFESYGDEGSSSRFFYCAKATKQDRGENNIHPTVKPTELMRWLCRLVTPIGEVVLDPFMGSGSTGKAAILEGFQFIGVENNPDYFSIAQKRLGIYF